MSKCLLLVALVFVTLPVRAHQFRSAYVKVAEGSGEYTVQTRLPLLPQDRVAPVRVELPAHCRETGAARVRRGDVYLLNESRWRCTGTLTDAPLHVAGLGVLTPDVLVELRFASGPPRIFALDAGRPDFVFAPAARPRAVALRAYFGLGVEHILFGIDHLLFVLGLLLVVWRTQARRAARLLTTITAFTAAHSLTLAAAMLGAVRLPAAPVEAAIAASILLLAVELARSERSDALTLRIPWLPAFAFGLLHGFGFAGALSDIGLPEQARVPALALFNLGVEIGQLAFVAAMLAATGALGHAIASLHLPPLRTQRLATQLLGTVAGFWVVERTIAVLA
ncbi:MAG: HupE/UreJ family protein [Pseudomonadota bacterium]|nr:HupE/UreJ family protein [Pseudomonadota bacterium]